MHKLCIMCNYLINIFIYSMQYIIYVNRYYCAVFRCVRNVVIGCLERCRMANLRTRVGQGTNWSILM